MEIKKSTKYKNLQAKKKFISLNNRKIFYLLTDNGFGKTYMINISGSYDYRHQESRHFNILLQINYSSAIINLLNLYG